MPLASFIVICYNNKEVIFGLLLPVFDWRIIFSKFNKERTVTMRVLEREYLPRSASPEEAGVSSVAVAAFMEDMKKSGIENHSFLILRHGKVAAECFFAPFTRDTPHAMYSVSKSFTSTAIGFAVEEGLLSLDAKVIDFFPEYAPLNRTKSLKR